MTNPLVISFEQWESRSHRIVVDGVASRYWVEGQGEPVLCFHGVPASAYLYRKVLPALAARGFRAIAFDLPGMGLADRPVDFDYSWSGLSDWAFRFAAELGLDKYHLLVHDIGGPIGFDVIRRDPGRVASLTVLNTMIEVSRFRPPWVMRPFRWSGLGEIYLASMTPAIFGILMKTHGTVAHLSPAEISTYVRLLKRVDSGRAFLRIMRGFELTRAFEDRICSALTQRLFPAQVMWGESDPALSMKEYGPVLVRRLGVDSVRALPGKHFVQEDSADAIASGIAGMVR